MHNQVSEKTVSPSSQRCLTPPPARINPNATMRKYQQLALVIITIVSLAAFLFYKHEYERLRYTLEYLETFGNPPVEGDVRPQLGYSTRHKTMTPPVDWMQLTSDLAVYSAFWDEGNGLVSPQVRTIAVIKKSTQHPVNLKSVFWYEKRSETVSASCKFEKAKDRQHGISSEGDVHIMYILCTVQTTDIRLKTQTPYMIQFSIADDELSVPLFVHETEPWKTVEDKFVMCIVPSNVPINSLRIIEYIAFHSVIGVEKFTFYGPILTPLSRKLLDKYGDESGIMYEEKQFTSISNFKIPEKIKRIVIELDCIYRHLDSHENIIVLPVDEYIVPHDRSSLQDVVSRLSRIGSKRNIISEFHLSTQQVCIDVEHNNKATLLLAKQIHSIGTPSERGVAILRPHAMQPSSGSSTEQHISKGTTVIYHYAVCPADQNHPDTDHLSNSAKFVGLVENSLLYRKWKINR